VSAENQRYLGRCLVGRYRLGHANGACGQVWFGLACDDLRLVGLKLIFLVVTRAVSVLGLSRRESCSKTDTKKITWSGKTPGQDGCAARDSNPEPAD
jgi:hypothetical protein